MDREKMIARPAPLLWQVRVTALLLLLAAARASAAPDFTPGERDERLSRYAGFTSDLENCADRTAETAARLGGYALGIISVAVPPTIIAGQVAVGFMLQFPPNHRCFCEMRTRLFIQVIDPGGDEFPHAVVVRERRFYCVRHQYPRNKLLSREIPCEHPEVDFVGGGEVYRDQLVRDCP
jgi:hypothetical protein